MPVPISGSLFSSHRRGCKTFIETGTYLGDGVVAACSAGFDVVYSIEIDKARYDGAVSMFRGNDRVKLILGDSTLELRKLLETIREPYFAWIDAHKSNEGELGGWVSDQLPVDMTTLLRFPVSGSVWMFDDTTPDLRDMISHSVTALMPDAEFSIADGYDDRGRISYPKSIAVCFIK